jgi:hypothetical protein
MAIAAVEYVSEFTPAPARATYPSPGLPPHRPPSAGDQRTPQDIQAELEPWFNKVGLRAPRPVGGQSANHYLAEQCRFLKQEFLSRNDDYYKVQWRSIRDDSNILNNLVPQLLRRVVKEAYNPNCNSRNNVQSGVAKGEIKMVEELDDLGITKVLRPVGRECFVKSMGTPGRRVVGFRTEHGYVNTTGNRLR